MAAIRIAAWALLAGSSFLFTGCATQDEVADEGEPVFIPEDAPAPDESVPARELPADTGPAPGPGPSPEEGEVPPVVAETEPPASSEELAEVVVAARPRGRDEVIRDLVAEARALLRDVQLQYVFTGKGRRETLRGRPVAFALWSEAKQEVDRGARRDPAPADQVEAGRPAPQVHRAPRGHHGAPREGHRRRAPDVRVHQGRRAAEGLRPQVPGLRRRAAEEEALARRRRRPRGPSSTCRSPQDTLDPLFVSGGREFLLATARKAIEELRAGERPVRGLPRRAARRCRARRGHHDPRGDRADRRRRLRAQPGDRVQRGAEPVRPEARRGLSLQRLARQGHRPDAVHQPARQRHLFAGRAALPRGAARPELRARRHRPAERDEGRDLPVRHRAEPDARRDPRGLPRQQEGARHLPGRRLQRRPPQRRQALPRDPEDAA